MYDLCIIGGGINGTGIARDAAGRGYRVLLVEQGDLASVTSSASTKLIHGGLRYLEHYEFRLVRESLTERERLWAIAPHLIRPLTFILPHRRQIRPAWLICLGLFLYDHLGGREKLPSSRALNLKKASVGRPLQEDIRIGFSYADCWVDDSRLVILNAKDAANFGADILPQTQCLALKPSGGKWDITLKDNQTGAIGHVAAKRVVNAGGPYVRNILEESNLVKGSVIPRARLVQGSHIVVPRLYEGEQAYILQQPDRRIVFAIPYENEFTLIGTTDTDFSGDPRQAAITEDEKEYLCRAVNHYFKRQIGSHDIVWSYSGVRALFDDGQESASVVTRDYVLKEQNIDGAYILSVFGGKLTTYRKLAEQVCDKLDQNGPGSDGPWTGIVPLPGGELNGLDFSEFVTQQLKKWPQYSPDLILRMARAYGTVMDKILEAPGERIGEGVLEGELRYLVAEEWARSADDILWRRSKLGLHISPHTQDKIRQIVPDLVKEIMGNDIGTLASGN